MRNTISAAAVAALLCLSSGRALAADADALDDPARVLLADQVL